MSERSAPTARTRIAAVIGDPISHSLSPAIHNAAFAAADLDWVFLAFHVPAGLGGDAVAAMRTLGLAGLSVTMPHKSDAAAACDVLTDDALVLQGVNTVVRRDDGRLLGDSTDGPGFLRALADEGMYPRGLRAVIVGAGGAARSVALALGRDGARVTVAARRLDAAQEAAALADGVALALDDADATLADADLIVQCTPVGMQDDALPFDPQVLRGQFVADLVYFPAETPLLVAALERGCPTMNGLGMLVHQAALAFELWTGRAAPGDAMRRAATEALLSGS